MKITDMKIRPKMIGWEKCVLTAAAAGLLLVVAGFASSASAQRFQFRFGTTSRPLES